MSEANVKYQGLQSSLKLSDPLRFSQLQVIFSARALIPSIWNGSLRASRHWAVQEPIVDLHICLYHQGAKG